MILRPPPLADAAEPLGKLQRGLGSGYLWALDAHHSVGHALVIHCLFNDPRWDHQLDARDEYYATLALDIELDLEPLESWLRDHDAESPEVESNVLGLLGRMAIRDHPDARRILREYVAYGRSWQRAITLLTGDPEAMPVGPPWPEVVAGLDQVLIDRFPSESALAEALAEVDSRDRPWTLWSVENHKIAGALAAGHRVPLPPRTRRRPQRRKPPNPRTMSTEGLLQIPEESRWRQIADELTLRRSRDDVQRMLAAARDPERAMRRAAILALANQGRRDVLAIAEETTHEEQRGKLQGTIALALEAMPLAQTRALAHDWLTSADWSRRRKAAGILGSHAEREDLEPARDALWRELDAGLEGDVYVVCSLAEALGRCADDGPFEELTRAYEEIPYSYGRRFIVSALAATDPTFAGDLAVECLWDCELESRTIAAEHVDRRIRLASQRLQELVDDEAQAGSVRRAAGQE
ncbi:MAG: HEAT repeat domain-containing protein [Solirubrobacteraceae bacterium]